jgi:hypothetical protein
MPDQQSSTDETTHLFGGRKPPVTEWQISLELIKAFGLSVALVSIIGGYFSR